MTNELAVTDLTVPTATLAASEIDLRLDSTVEIRLMSVARFLPFTSW